MKSTNALWGFLTGAAAGAIMGILYAPYKGKETRTKIKDQALRTTEDVKENLSHKIDELNTFISRFAKETQSKIDDLERKSQHQVSETKTQIK
jgi:gas vesicle protein